MDIYERILNLIENKSISKSELEFACGLSNGYINKIKTSQPSPQKLKLIADYFSVPVDYLLTGDMPDYYENKEANELAQFLFENPGHKVLFDASKKIKKEDLEVVLKLLEKFGE